MTKFD